MTETLIPLDIAYIREDGIIESIKQLEPNNPIPVHSEGNIELAIEVNRGWFAENNVEVGDELSVEYVIPNEPKQQYRSETGTIYDIISEVKDKKSKGSGSKDACYHKVKSRYSVWPSAYASGALVKCRKVGAANWGNSRKEEVEYEVNEGRADSPKMKMAPMSAPMKMAPMMRVGDELTPQQKAGVKRYHKDKKDRKERNVGYKPGAFYDKKGKNPDTGAQRAIGGQGGFKSRRSSGPSKDFRDDIGEGVSPVAPALTLIPFPEPVPKEEISILSSSTCDVVADVPIMFTAVE